jgi:hypothetical protein
MYNKSVRILVLVCITSLFVSCDKEEDPIISATGDYLTVYGPPPTFQPEGVPHQRVLLEDFTGHQCGFCPLGHIEAADLLETYRDDISVVAIHAGTLADPLPPSYPADWTTPEGEFYLLTQVGSQQMPRGRINRSPSAATVFEFLGWDAEVANAFTQIPEVNLQVKTDFRPATNHWNVHVFSEWLQNVQGTYRLVVLLTESNIIAPQLFYGNSPENVTDYSHEHVLRISGTGATGLPLFVNPSAGNSINSYTFNWNNEWNPEHCEVVVFITDGENGRVLNVAKTKLIP